MTSDSKKRTCPDCDEEIRSWDDHACDICDQCPRECDCDEDF